MDDTEHVGGEQVFLRVLGEEPDLFNRIVVTWIDVVKIEQLPAYFSD